MRIKLLFNKLINKLIIWKRRQFYSIRIDRKDKRLILHEKYEKFIKWALRIVFVIGIISSVLSMTWYFSLILTLLLLGFEYFLEKTGFMFTTLFIQPIPTPALRRNLF